MNVPCILQTVYQHRFGYFHKVSVFKAVGVILRMAFSVISRSRQGCPLSFQADDDDVRISCTGISVFKARWCLRREGSWWQPGHTQCTSGLAGTFTLGLVKNDILSLQKWLYTSWRGNMTCTISIQIYTISETIFTRMFWSSYRYTNFRNENWPWS